MIKGKKLIQIRGTGFNNKGAELMLYAVLEKMKHEREMDSILNAHICEMSEGMMSLSHVG